MLVKNSRQLRSEVSCFLIHSPPLKKNKKNQHIKNPPPIPHLYMSVQENISNAYCIIFSIIQQEAMPRHTLELFFYFVHECAILSTVQVVFFFCREIWSIGNIFKQHHIGDLETTSWLSRSHHASYIDWSMLKQDIKTQLFLYTKKKKTYFIYSKYLYGLSFINMYNIM